MANTFVNPDGLFESIPMGYSHAVKRAAGETVHISGQVAWDKNCSLVGANDVGAQARQVLTNLKQVLEAAGADESNVVSLRIYVVGLDPSMLEPIGIAIAEFYGAVTPAANTMLGVHSLALPEFLIEIEAVAVV